MSQTETSKDPTQSSHYRLWGPGFLDVSLVPEEQELATPTQPPSSTIQKKYGRRTTIKSPGQSTTRTQGKTDHQASTEVPAQTMATSGMNLDALASLHADELQKLIKSIQGLAASRQEETTPPPKTTHTCFSTSRGRGNQVQTSGNRTSYSHRGAPH